MICRMHDSVHSLSCAVRAGCCLQDAGPRAFGGSCLCGGPSYVQAPAYRMHDPEHTSSCPVNARALDVVALAAGP